MRFKIPINASIISFGLGVIGHDDLSDILGYNTFSALFTRFALK